MNLDGASKMIRTKKYAKNCCQETNPDIPKFNDTSLL